MTLLSRKVKSTQISILIKLKEWIKEGSEGGREKQREGGITRGHTSLEWHSNK